MLIKLVRLILKGPLVAAFIILFFITGLLNKILFFYSPYLRKCLAQRNTQWTSWICRHLIGYTGDYRINHIPKGNLIICNHMSYMDVLVIASKIPTLFVTSTEMRDTPFLGWITRLGECLYVNRKSHKNINTEIKDIQDWINRGFNVLIFPEATTSNGVELRPFKSSLLKISQNGTVPVTAYCLKYTGLNGSKASAEQIMNNISWFENASFLPHVFKQFMNKHVEFLLVEVDHFISNPELDRKSVVLRLETVIQDEFYKTVSV